MTALELVAEHRERQRVDRTRRALARVHVRHIAIDEATRARHLARLRAVALRTCRDCHGVGWVGPAGDPKPCPRCDMAGVEAAR